MSEQQKKKPGKNIPPKETPQGSRPRKKRMDRTVPMGQKADLPEFKKGPPPPKKKGAFQPEGNKGKRTITKSIKTSPSTPMGQTKGSHPSTGDRFHRGTEADRQASRAKTKPSAGAAATMPKGSVTQTASSKSSDSKMGLGRTLMMSGPPPSRSSHEKLPVVEQESDEQTTVAKKPEQGDRLPINKSALDDTPPPESPLELESETEPFVPTVCEEPESEPMPEPEPTPVPVAVEPRPAVSKNVLTVVAAVIGFLLVISLAVNVYLWSALDEVKTSLADPGEQEIAKPASTEKEGEAEPSPPPSQANDQKQAGDAEKNAPVGAASSGQAAVDPAAEAPSREAQASPAEVASDNVNTAAGDESSTPAKGMGRLVILQAKGDEREIRVSINKRFRGNAPLELDLKPKRYDVNFSSRGKRGFRRVRIKADKTVTITARVNRR